MKLFTTGVPKSSIYLYDYLYEDVSDDLPVAGLMLGPKTIRCGRSKLDVGYACKSRSSISKPRTKRERHIRRRDQMIGLKHQYLSEMRLRWEIYRREEYMQALEAY